MANQSHEEPGKEEQKLFKTLSIFFFKTRSRMISELGMEHRGLQVCKVCINCDLRLALTYFVTRSNLVTCTFLRGKVLDSRLHVIGNSQTDKKFLSIKET